MGAARGDGSGQMTLRGREMGPPLLHDTIHAPAVVKTMPVSPWQPFRWVADLITRCERDMTILPHGL
jgi:hypothetical protein